MKVDLKFVVFEPTRKSMQFLPREMNETEFKGSGGKRCLRSKNSYAPSNHSIATKLMQNDRIDDCASIETRIKSIGRSADFLWIFFRPSSRQRRGHRARKRRPRVKKSYARSNHSIGTKLAQNHRGDDCASIETRNDSIGRSANFR
jgi:hypothetical protein